MVERVKRKLSRGALLVLFGALTLIFLEGAASLALLVRAAIALGRGHSDNSPIQFDAELGWGSIPNYRQAEKYGPGADVTINSQGFRADHDFSPAPPPGRDRLVCLGDSMTFGLGVDDRATWCAEIERLAPRVETVNMGRCGYGIDQAYLWYKRDGLALGHSLLVFAFIKDDFRRTNLKIMWGGYPKPTLAPDGRESSARPFGSASGLSVDYGRIAPPSFATKLSFLYRSSLLSILGVQGKSGSYYGYETVHEPEKTLYEIVFRVFEDLERINREKGSRLLLVFLPSTDDLPSGRSGIATRLWVEWLQKEAERRGLSFLNLLPAFSELGNNVNPLYLDTSVYAGHPDLPRAIPGHFSPEGHRFVARAIHARLAPSSRGTREGNGEPNNQGGVEHYAEMNNYLWNDNQLDAIFPAVAEVDCVMP